MHGQKHTWLRTGLVIFLLGLASLACSLLPDMVDLAGGGDDSPREQAPAVEVPSGEYRGEFPWNEDSINELDVNQIVIAIGADGTVSGLATFAHHNYETHNAAGGECTSYYDFSTEYVISGQITGSFKQPVIVDKTTKEISDWRECGQDLTERDETCTCEGSLTISDGELTVTCGTGGDCGAYLTAQE